MKKKNIFISLGFVFIISVLGLIVYNFNNSYALIENGSRVKPNTELTYYIDVIYDGKDKEMVVSDDSTIAKVNSDYIYVEDRLPEGLTFLRFITAEDGTIGAVKRDGSGSCAGSVVGDADGLVYDETTRTVKFTVKSLQAGCKLTVGVVTKTPVLGEQKRIDFYNTAVAHENAFTAISNTVHVFMGREEIDRYNVIYEYEGIIPDGAPALPTGNSYIEGANVGVENNVTLNGYEFSGWTTNDVEIIDNSFSMPNKDVTFTGSFTKKEEFDVSYNIEGAAPSRFIPPTSKSYGIGDNVVIDSLTTGDIIKGYRFLGWTSNDIELDDHNFIMPDENVELIGRFEKIEYEVSYAFQGTEVPDNSESLLPTTSSYAPGDIVTVAENPEASGYDFLGWYSDSTFKMPEENVVIYGEWMRQTGTFEPTIVEEIVNNKDCYRDGDKVRFKITITNTASFTINTVSIMDNLKYAYFDESDSYEMRSDNYIVIPSIASGESVVVYANYLVSDDIVQRYNNVVELTGALADNNYTLDTSHEYKANANFVVANTKLIINSIDNDNNPLEGSIFTLCTDSNGNNCYGEGLEFDINPSTTYYLKETRAPTGYQILTSLVRLVVDDDGKIDGSTFENGINTIELRNNEINLLPNTGGIGTYIFTYGGLVLIIGSLVGFWYLKKRKENNNEKNN